MSDLALPVASEDGDYAYSPLSVQELRDTVGLGPNNYYDIRLRDLQNVAVEEVAEYLGRPPVAAPRIDRYDRLAKIVSLSAPATIANPKPMVYAGAGAVASTVLDRFTLRLNADPPSVERARVEYESAEPQSPAGIEHAVRRLVAWHFAELAGNKQRPYPRRLIMRLLLPDRIPTDARSF